MLERIKKLQQKAKSDIPLVKTREKLEELRVELLGRKGELTAMLRKLSELEPKLRGQVGAAANRAKKAIEQMIDEHLEDMKKTRFENLEETDSVDITMPVAATSGHLHPLTQTWHLIEDIFQQLGFDIADGPEAEWDDYNFTLLNMHKDHPARDTQDTFYFSPEILLRTQTSPMQIRYMQNRKSPIRVIVPGRVYRRDYDLTHTPMFHQFEGLVVGEDITISDLKGTCVFALRALLGEEIEFRFRPHHFPFTEPSLEVDVTCTVCGGQGCRTCKQTGWLEMAGAGMVHPQVLRNVKYNPEQVSGFAFGFGLDRIAMMRFGVADLRMMFENDMRFLQQF